MSTGRVSTACPKCDTPRGQVRGIDPTFEVWDGAFCSRCGWLVRQEVQG